MCAHWELMSVLWGRFVDPPEHGDWGCVCIGSRSACLGADCLRVDFLGVDCLRVDFLRVDFLGADCLRVDCLGVDCLRVDCLGVDCLRVNP